MSKYKRFKLGGNNAFNYWWEFRCYHLKGCEDCGLKFICYTNDIVFINNREFAELIDYSWNRYSIHLSTRTRNRQLHNLFFKEIPNYLGVSVNG